MFINFFINKMTEELITSKSGLDLNEMIKDAEFQVEFYTKELKKNHETLYARKLALNALKKQRGIYKLEKLTDKFNGTS